MSKLNPIEKSDYIRVNYTEYLRSSFKFGSSKLQKLYEEQLSEEELFKGPYVDLNLPFKRGSNITSLIREGVMCNSFKKLNDIDFERLLYSHQEDAIRKIGSGRSAIITTGTGSGKTESFLYPILNELMSDVEKGNREIGVRAIFLYPMNALVNDQIERVRKILTGCPDITYGFFTGDTPEKTPANYKKKYGEENNVIIPDNELVSREEIRNNPPHLLFTNYSMLEFLLIRPNDYSVLSPAKLKNWKFVVLDEAHSYYGSLGIELSMLLRRLTGLVEHKPRFILTSATLGEEGKSEQEIVNFARNLTSVSFDISDIIFSKRIQLDSNSTQYRVAGDDYNYLKSAVKNVEEIRRIASKYRNITSSDARGCLYELLSADKNVHLLYESLLSNCKSFKSLLEQYNLAIDSEQLINLIDLINYSEKDGIGLFDLKYHSFVRPISGAYITLGENPKLSLSKTNSINGLKAFEVGNCRYCNSPYIIGKIQPNISNELEYLFQNKEIDIYENYGDNEYISIDYFLMENAINEDEVDRNILEEYTICSKCGALHATQNLNAKKCDCGTEYSVSIYKVKRTKESQRKISNDEDTSYNNINQCPCCGHKGHSGVVKSLNLGKDEGTAIVAQMLLEALDEGEVAPKAIKKISLLPRTETHLSDAGSINCKQFLQFSDSRQQASFAAVFFDVNQKRMLNKRLIWKAIEDHNYYDITVDELVAYLTSFIKENNLLSDNLSAHKKAWVSVLIDLLKVDGAYDGEGLGLYFFELDVSDIFEQISEDDVRNVFGRHNINKSELETIMKVVLDVFKTTPAISYVRSTLTPEEKKEFLEYRRFDNYVMYRCSKASTEIKSFLPIISKENAATRYVQKACGCETEDAVELLNIIFNNLAVEGDLLKKHPFKEAYQIDASKYILKNYKSSKYYVCSKCGRLTPYNVHNVCVQDKCDGVLVEADPDLILKSNYYRQKYMTKKIENIVIKEHTAQLDKKTAKQYQQDFKAKKINILSCSTTFEMGIDIGGLETVFMRNVPPSPANYVQRAGRAGRRKDSSAYILTYCSTSSHDYTYFCEPERMISGKISPPVFDVVNRKIILRHLMAICLGFFFRLNPEYFESIDNLVFKDGINEFKKYVLSHPEDLNNYIKKQVLPEEQYKSYHDFKWFDDMDGNDEKMQNFVETIKAISDEYAKAKQLAISEEKFSEADFYTNQINRLHKDKVIDSLSKYCVIPKYGFPVDVVELQIYEEGRLNNRYDLNRDLKIAISEYAPDSEIIVDGKKYTSKYISLPKTGQYPKHYFCTCSECKKVNVFLSTRTATECKYCGKSLSEEIAEFYIDPSNGFKTGVTKESSRMKPKRSYSGEVAYLGGGIKDENRMEIGDIVLVETSTNDELLVINKSNFYMCPVCGYGDRHTGKVSPPMLLKEHKNYKQYLCENNNLEKVRLGHSFQTDVARLTFPLLSTEEKNSNSIALSFLYAFLEGISISLGIERNDIDGVVELNLDKHSYDIIIYDNVPGGAGHVKRLVSRKAIIDVLKAALNKVSAECCDENTSCYNCLRNYYNQLFHNKLQRKYAKERIEEILQAIELQDKYLESMKEVVKI